MKSPSFKVKSIRLILLTSAGRIYLQKRSKIKNDNRGLYDKTVGGHVQAGSTFEMTVVKECAEELGFAASIFSEKEFNMSIKSTDLKTVAIVKKLEYVPNFKSTRLIGKKKITQTFMTTFYIGYYDGAVRFADGESSGIETYSLIELEKEIKTHPERFTQDLLYIVKKYKKFLKPISK